MTEASSSDIREGLYNACYHLRNAHIVDVDIAELSSMLYGSVMAFLLFSSIPEPKRTKLQNIARLSNLLQSEMMDLDWMTKVVVARSIGKHNKFNQTRINLAKMSVVDLQTSDNKAQRRGRKNNLEAIYIAYQCAVTFYAITGTMPSVHQNAYAEEKRACGPFFEFLKTIFILIGLDSNPEHYGKRAAKTFKESNARKGSI